MGLWRGDRRKAWEREEEVWLIKTWLLKGQNNWTKWNTDTLNYDDKHKSIQFINYWSFWREKPADPPDLKLAVKQQLVPPVYQNIGKTSSHLRVCRFFHSSFWLQVASAVHWSTASWLCSWLKWCFYITTLLNLRISGWISRPVWTID